MHRNYGGETQCIEMSAFVHYAVFGCRSQVNVISINLEYISQQMQCFKQQLLKMIACVLVSSDIFVLVLILQMGVCLFILFADIPELHRRLDVSIFSGTMGLCIFVTGFWKRVTVGTDMDYRHWLCTLELAEFKRILNCI